MTVSEHADRSPPRLAYRLVLLAALGLMLWLNLPGHMSVDSVLALHEGRFHVRAPGLSPAIFAWLLGGFDAIRAGVSLSVAASGALLFGTWALMASLRPRTSWIAPLAALAAAALPQVAIYPAIVWKDVWFANAAIAGFVLLALGLQRRAGWARWSLWIVAAVLFAAAGLLRQNGLVLVPAAMAAIVLARRSGGVARAFVAAVGWAAAVAAATVALAVVCQSTGPGPPDNIGQRGVRLLQVYDLVGAAAREPLRFARLDRVDPAIGAEIAAARGIYSAERIDTLSHAPQLSRALRLAPRDAIAAEWRALVTQRPGLYLATRAEVFRWVFETPAIRRCLPIHVGVEGQPARLADLGIASRRTARDAALYDYAARFFGTPAYSHVAYALVALAVGLVLLLRGEPADLAMAGLMAGALAFAASFFVISLACDYRYLYLLDMAAITGVLYLALDPGFSRRRGRRPARR